jgi:hypothetical protein
LVRISSSVGQSCSDPEVLVPHHFGRISILKVRAEEALVKSLSARLSNLHRKR